MVDSQILKFSVYIYYFVTAYSETKHNINFPSIGSKIKQDILEKYMSGTINTSEFQQIIHELTGKKIVTVEPSEKTIPRKLNYNDKVILGAIVAGLIAFLIWPMLIVALVQISRPSGLHLSFSYLIAEGIWGGILGCFVYAMWLDKHDHDPSL